MTIDIDALKQDKRPQSSILVHALINRLEAAEKERDALRAKIAEMEKQEPVGKFTQHPSNGLWEQDGYGDNPEASPLYALPGAQTQGEEK